MASVGEIKIDLNFRLFGLTLDELHEAVILWRRERLQRTFTVEQYLDPTFCPLHETGRDCPEHGRRCTR